MSIKEWVTQINKQAPSVEQVVAKYNKVNLSIDEHKAKEHLRRLEIVYTNSFSNKVFENKLEELIQNTNISQIGIGVLSFYSKIESCALDFTYFEFASYNDFYKICFNEHIVMYSDEALLFEDVAINSDVFLAFLVEYNKYYMFLSYGVQYDEAATRKQLSLLISQGMSNKIVKDFFS